MNKRTSSGGIRRGFGSVLNLFITCAIAAAMLLCVLPTKSFALTAIHFSKITISNPKLYDDDSLESFDVTLVPNGLYASAEGRIAIQTEEFIEKQMKDNGTYADKHNYQNWESVASGPADSGFVTWETGEPFDWTTGETTRTVKFNRGVVPLNEKKTFYACLWTLYSGDIYPDDMLTSFSTQDGALLDDNKEALITTSGFTITFDPAGGSVSPTTAFTDSSGKLSELPAPTRTGYNFEGWYTQQTDGTLVDKSTVFTGTGTVYAHWSNSSYSVTLYANGGTVATGKGVTSYTYGTGATLPTGDEIAKTGYVFGGWFDNSSFSGSAVTNITTTDCGDKSFYAKWTANSYTVAYDGNKPAGASGEIESVPENQNCTYDVNYSLASAPTLTGYTFGGWYKEPDCTTSVGGAGASVKNTAASGTVKLYAKWTANSYTVTLDRKGGTTAGTTSVTATYDSAMPDITLPTRTGYTFGGYYTETGGSGTQYYTQAGTSAASWNIANSTTTLYAKWTANSYTVAYDGNKPAGASGEVESVPKSQNCTYDANYTLASAPTLTGYTFGGWYKESACNTSVGGAGASVKNTAASGTVKLYAKWTADAYAVKLDREGGTTGSENCTATYDSASLANYSAPTRPGYTFEGYYTGDNGTGALAIGTDDKPAKSVVGYTDGNGKWIRTTTPTTLYAKWTRNNYTVSYDTKQHGGITGSTTANVETAYSDKLVPDDGYSLPASVSVTMGGATFTDFSYTQSTGAISIATGKITGDVVVTGACEPNSYTVAYCGNKPAGASGGVTNIPKNQSCTYDVSYSLASAPTLTGYTFGGWYKESDCTTSVGGAGASVKNTATSGTVELYAKWTVDAYAVTLDREGGTTGSENCTATYDSASLANYSAPTRPGYTFEGYYTGDNGTGALVIGADNSLKERVGGYTDADGKWIRADVATLYAKWTRNDYTVSYDKKQHGGITGSTTANVENEYSDTLVADIGYSLPASVSVTMGGAEFTDFNYSQSTGAIYITAGRITGDVVVTGACVPSSYSVHYNGNGATGGNTANSSHTYDAARELAKNGFARAYTVAYHYNGATGGNSNATGTAAYLFGGWNTRADGTGTSYADGESVTNLATGATFELYACWNSASVTLPSPARGGYTFLGWYSDAALTEANRVGSGGASYTPTGDISLYAGWRLNTYTIALSSHAADLGDTTQGYTSSPAAIVTITNTGNSAIFGYSVSGGGTAFDVSYTSAYIAPGSTSSFAVQPAQGLPAGAYSAALTVVTTAGTSQTVNVSFDVYSAPAVAISGETSVIDGQSTTLTASVTGGKAPYVYLWSTSDITSGITVSPVSATTYTVTVEDALGVRATASAVVSVSIPASTAPQPANEAAPEPPEATDTAPFNEDASDAAVVTESRPASEPVPEPSDSPVDDEPEAIAGIELTPAEEIRDPELKRELDGADDTEKTFDYGDGQVVIIIPLDEGIVIAELPDEKAVIETLLSLEELGQVANGATIEIRLDVKRIADAAPEEDKQTIEKAIEAFSQEIPEITLGSYLDISLSKRINAGEWQAVADAGKTIEVVIDVPEGLFMKNTEYFILRSHEGGYTLLEDQDNDPKTVTVLTQYFSTYAIAYRAAAPSTTLWLWLLLIAAAAVTILILIFMKRKKDKEQDARV